MSILFQSVWIAWLLSEILVNRLFRSKQAKSKELDRGSIYLIWITITVSITLGVICAYRIQTPIMHSRYVSYAGLAIIVAGMIIRFIAIRTLGKAFTVNLAMNETQQLVAHGLYKYIRHPSYSASLLSFIGFGLSLNNWISLAAVIVPVTLAFLYRISIEEKMLMAQPGLDYAGYKSKTKRLIPKFY